MATKRQRKIILYLKYLVFLIEKEFGMAATGPSPNAGASETVTFDSSSFKFNLRADLENNFTYHPPKPDQPERYQAIREKAKELAYLIDRECPKSRERSIAMTELETAVFWANAAIARNE